MLVQLESPEAGACFALFAGPMNIPERWRITDIDVPFKLATLWVFKVGGAFALFGTIVGLAWFFIFTSLIGLGLSHATGNHALRQLPAPHGAFNHW